KAGVALPFAAQMIGQNAFAAGGYKNVLFMYAPNGVHPTHWNPNFTGKISSSNELSFGLGSLKDWHNNIIVLKNIYIDIEGGGGGDGGGHTNAQLGCLTGNHYDEAIPSIDHMIAEKLGNKGVLSVGVRTGNGMEAGKSLMVSKPRNVGNSNRPIPNNNPFDVATKLKSRVTPTPPNPLQAKVFAAAAADMTALSGTKLADARQLKIDQHQAALAKLKDQQQEGTLNVNFDFSQKETLGLTESFSSKANKLELIAQFPELCKAQINNVVASFANGLYRVATLQMSTGNENMGRVVYNFEECWTMSQLAKSQNVGSYLADKGNEGDHMSHGPSHKLDSCSFQGQTRWHSSMMAYAMQQLKAAGILDETLVVLFSEEGDNNHDLQFGGIVVGGGAGAGLSMGRVIDCGSSKGNGTHKLFGDVARWAGAQTTEGPWKSGII
ncbi:MAG TPA: DUF1552 domain-containing protein, partial [Cellvibrio sp.]|nr:DUF1552 domain-containing protein [Cellvibrio sp.]